MIIILTEIKVIEFPEISSQFAPSTIFFELVTASNKTGIITGKERIAIIVDWFSVFEAIDEIKVNATAIPIAPIIKFKIKRGKLSIGFPRNVLKRNNAMVTNTNSYIKWYTSLANKIFVELVRKK